MDHQPDDMQDIQQRHHVAGYDYAEKSPHIKHPKLRDWVTNHLRVEIDRVAGDLQRPPLVLEVGAGHGTFTSDMVAAGAEVVVTEMSKPSASHLKELFKEEPKVNVYLSREGEAPKQKFDIAVFTSVLHHIPDYLQQLRTVVEDNLESKATLMSFQDPTWYPRMPLWHRAIAQACFVPWRLTQGDIAQGASSMYRRLRNQRDLSRVSDMSEYHVVRQGVDEEGIRDVLSVSFTEVDVLKYWSTQSAKMQELGWNRFPSNTFGVIARRG